MYVFLTILILIVCVLLILAVLIQNPKGGGLSATFGGVGNQVMGARRATDFIEKTTWTLVVILLSLSLLSGMFMPQSGKKNLPKSEVEEKMNKTELPVIPGGGIDPLSQPPAE
ncbi:MAG: hypothetical protein KatS3mg031_2152 [Chitinophagales bacterium]|nr:MAG: hypothetical protein KatS3mg031_2152 [Chitinophagales bacterium]